MLGFLEVGVDPTIAGVALLVLGVTFIGAEAHLATSGVFAGLALAALVGAGLLLFETDAEEVEVSLPIVAAVVVVVGAFTWFAVRKVAAARREPIRTGWEELSGAEGDVRVALDPEGQVYVEGALWRARLVGGPERLERGSRVRVESVEGLTLLVSPTSEEGET